MVNSINTSHVAAARIRETLVNFCRKWKKMLNLLHKKHKSRKSKMAHGDEDRTEVNSDLTVLQNSKIARPRYAEKGGFTETEGKGTTRKKGLFTLPLSQKCYRKETSCY